jgi:hypothetical protein
LSLIGEPTGGTYCRVAGLQTPYNGIAILEFQDFAKFFSRAGKDGLTTAKAAGDRPGLITFSSSTIFDYSSAQLQLSQANPVVAIGLY